MRKKSNAGIIDSHVHFDDILSIKKTRSFFDNCGIDKLCIVSIPDAKMGNSNPQALCFKMMYPSETYIMGSLYYAHIERYCLKDRKKRLKEQLIKMIETGFDGVKILETKPNLFKRMPFKIDDPEYEDFFEIVQKKQFPVVWHVVDPPEFWDRRKIHPIALKRGWGYFSKGFPSYEEIRQRVNRVLSNFPHLKIIFAHFYFLSQDLEIASEVLEKYESVNFDIAPGAEMFVNFSKNPEKTRDFFIRYQDRIVFGTDAFISKKFSSKATASKIKFMKRFLETEDNFRMPVGDMNFLSQPGSVIRGIRLPAPVLQKIYRRNFERIVGKKPARIDKKLAMDGCKKIADELKDFLNRQNNCGYACFRYPVKISGGLR